MCAGDLKVGEAETGTRAWAPSRESGEKVALHCAVDHHRSDRLGWDRGDRRGRVRSDALLACADGERCGVDGIHNNNGQWNANAYHPYGVGVLCSSGRGALGGRDGQRHVKGAMVRTRCEGLEGFGAARGVVGGDGDRSDR